jgi:hypothetical protein
VPPAESSTNRSFDLMVNVWLAGSGMKAIVSSGIVAALTFSRVPSKLKYDLPSIGAPDFFV